MKYILLIVGFTFLNCNLVLSQQWVDLKYNYDSVMNLNYGIATDFYGNPDSLDMDIYLPKCSDNNLRRPLALFIHGGAFLAGDKNEMTDYAKKYAQRGYVTATINYRKGFIADNVAHTCNYPAYECVFAANTAEWARAYYRAVQDGKGALRYMLNRNGIYNIDTNNIFLVGESAGAFVALGISLLDTVSERLPQTYALSSLPPPNSNTAACPYNVNQTIPSGMINRPDLGGIDGTIEPSTVKYTVKGIGNMYGGMLNDLLSSYPTGKVKPDIYSFHQPCDLVVPIDAGRIYQNTNWCLTNGYGCFGISKTPIIFGSRKIRDWNTDNSLGYTIQSEFTTTNFPFSYVGPGGCLDQVNNPCHAYDNPALRKANLANFFATKVSSDTCSNLLSVGNLNPDFLDIKIYPNPASKELNISINTNSILKANIVSINGEILLSDIIIQKEVKSLKIDKLQAGIYFIPFYSEGEIVSVKKFVVN